MLNARAKNRMRGLTLPQLLVSMSVVTVMSGMFFQSWFLVKRQADYVALVNQAGQYGTALELYFQRNNSYPDSSPAHLEQDLGPYIGDPKFFTDTANPAAGAGSVNSSYVIPVPSDPNSYVLSLNTKYSDDHAVVLFANSKAEVVETFPVLFNEEPAPAGTTVSEAGTIAFAGGSTIELSGAAAVTVVRSFRSKDGTPFNVIKTGQPGANIMTAVAVGPDIIEVASDSGITFLRGGVADVEIISEPAANKMKTTTRSGEVRVIGRQQDRGQTVANVVQDSTSAIEFYVDEDHNLVPSEDCVASITVLGTSITYGEGGPDCEVQVGASVGDDPAPLTGAINLNPSNNVNFEFLLDRPDGSRITRDDLLASNGLFNEVLTATRIRFRPKGNGNQNTLLLNGASYPMTNSRIYELEAEPGTEMTAHLYNDSPNPGHSMGHWWLGSVSGPSVRINGGGENWLWLFGGEQVYGDEVFSREISAGARVAVNGRASYGTWSSEYASTKDHRQVLVLLNGDTPPEFAPFDGQPEITEFCQSVIDASTGRITIEDHQAIVLFELGTTNMNSPAADFQDLVLLVDFAAIPTHGNSDNTNDDAPVDSTPIIAHEVIIADNNVITVNEDSSVCIRVLDSTMRDNRNRSVPIAMQMKVNDDWYNLRNGRSVYAGYLYKRQVAASSTIVLKATSYAGYDSATYDSADGSGHVLTLLRDEVPEVFSWGDAPDLHDFMAKAMDTFTHQVTLAENQALMMVELANDDAADPSATFQDVVVVLTFTPESLHNQNKDQNNFDGYGDTDSYDPMGVGAAAYAVEKEFDWHVGREGDLVMAVPEPSSEDPVDDQAADEYTNQTDENSETDDSVTQGAGVAGSCRTLNRGILVRKGRWVKVTRRY